MSDNVCSAISKSGVVENVGVAVEISFRPTIVIQTQESYVFADFKVLLVFRPPYLTRAWLKMWGEP